MALGAECAPKAGSRRRPADQERPAPSVIQRRPQTKSGSSARRQVWASVTRKEVPQTERKDS
jgi:hypothetical protein